MAAPVFIAAKVQRISSDNINDLKWQDELIHVRADFSNNQEFYTVILAARYSRPNWILVRNQKPVKVNAAGAFRIEAIITKDERAFDFEAIGPNGEKENEKIVISVPYWERSPLEPPARKWFLYTGLNFGSISVKETQLSDYSSLAATLKVASNYLLIPKMLDLGIAAYFTAFQFSKTDNINARYLGFNGRLGYIIPGIEAPWIVSLYLGFYYTTMFVDGNAFGYKNLGGPQIYPTVRRVLPNADVVSFYAKFSPIGSNFQLLTLTNRELAFGIGYLRPLDAGRTVSLTLDYSTLNIALDGIMSTTGTVSLGAQYGW